MTHTEHLSRLHRICAALTNETASTDMLIAHLETAPRTHDVTRADRLMRRTMLYLGAQRDEPALLSALFSPGALPALEDEGDTLVTDSLLLHCSVAAAPHVAGLLARDVARFQASGNLRLGYVLNALALRDFAAEALAAAGHIGPNPAEMDLRTRLEVIRAVAAGACATRRQAMVARPIAEHAAAFARDEALAEAS